MVRNAGGIMSREEIIKCDICDISNSEMSTHWSSGIFKLNLHFKNFPNIQGDIIIEDCCTSCAEKLFMCLRHKIAEMKGEEK